MKNFFILLTMLVKIGYSQTVTNASPEEFKKLIDSKKGIIIDLRTSDEIKSRGMIKGAVQLDFLSKDAEASIDQLDKKKTYLIYCAGGGRSGDAAEMMQKKGFKEVVNLTKGFDDWKKKGFAVETH